MSNITAPNTDFEPRSSKDRGGYFGEQHKYLFPNGYGASVIRGRHSYGGDDGLWELAVFGKDGDLDYSTPVTSDVEGHLSDEEVNKLLHQIAALPGDSGA